ncbi:MAG: hypothetical protein HYX73_05020 [Acidobacteria bacterium]|nr:hypothetical protein [Acidobacteriota bacterium]
MAFRNWICERFHNMTGPWRDETGPYERCIDCGRRIPWTDNMPLRDPTEAIRE